MPSNCTIVLGLPRSGTSICAAILSNLGVNMGTNLQPPNPWNAKGSFEDQDIVRQHLIGLGNGGLRWAYQMPPQPVTTPPQAWTDLINARLALGVPWGFKCSHAPFFISSILSMMPDVKVITTQRLFASSVASLVSVAPWPITAVEATATLTAYKNQLAAALALIPAPQLLTVQFADFFNGNASAVVTSIANFVGLPFAQSAVNWIDPTLQTAGG